MLKWLISINAIQVLEAEELNPFFGECFSLTVSAFVFVLGHSHSEIEFFGINIEAIHFLPFVLRISEISATVT